MENRATDNYKYYVILIALKCFTILTSFSVEQMSFRAFCLPSLKRFPTVHFVYFRIFFFHCRYLEDVNNETDANVTQTIQSKADQELNNWICGNTSDYPFEAEEYYCGQNTNFSQESEKTYLNL